MITASDLYKSYAEDAWDDGLNNDPNEHDEDREDILDDWELEFFTQEERFFDEDDLE